MSARYRVSDASLDGDNVLGEYATIEEAREDIARFRELDAQEGWTARYVITTTDGDTVEADA